MIVDNLEIEKYSKGCNGSSVLTRTETNHFPGQYLAVPATSASPERFFSRVGLVQSDLRGSILDTTMIDLMWATQAP
jgi:hypothetical protein